ncbi:MAG: hypothetical protein HUU50_16045 [Candidatus Brocadiae bacterium]|nr:hypothetical protein [Candidatus Brocadiia bacterium]
MSYSKSIFSVFLLMILAMGVVAQTNPADLDTTFGTNGKTTTDFAGSNDQALALALLPNGKILAAGYADMTPKTDFALARYNANGTLDTTFGTNGKTTTDFFDDADVAFGMAVFPDSKIILVGSAYNGAGADPIFALAKYNANGTLDTTFGTGGKVTTTFTGTTKSHAFSVIILSDGKILVGGHADAISTLWDFALAKYNADGSLDTTFGTGGKVTTDFSNTQEQGMDMVVLADGKILLVGCTNATPNYNFAMVRYNADGSLDTTFGTNGKTSTDFAGTNDIINRAVILAEGKILVTGYSGSEGGNKNVALARYSANGILDTTFGTNGKVTTDFFGADDSGENMKVFMNGKILVVGSAYNGAYQDFALVRYNADGTLDTTFGTGGKSTTNISTMHDWIADIAIQTDGKILVAGGTSDVSIFDFALARYMGDPVSINLQIGALPKAQAGLSEYVLALPFDSTPRDVTVIRVNFSMQHKQFLKLAKDKCEIFV